MSMPVNSPIDKDELSTLALRARSGFLWILSTTFIWQILSWILTLVTARLLSPTDYGLMAMLEALIPYMTMVTTLKLDIWLVQVDTLSTEDEDAIFTFALLLSLLCVVLTIIAAPLVSRFYGQAELTVPCAILSVTFLAKALRLVPEARLRRDLNLKPVALSNLAVGVSRGCLQVFLAWCGYGYWSLVYGAVIGEIALAIWLIAAAGSPSRFRWRHDVFERGIEFGLSATLATICFIIYSTTDNVIVGKLFGPEFLGYYSMAFFLTELPLSKINTVIVPVIAPYYSRVRTNIDELRRTFLRVSRTLMLIIAPVLLGLALVAPSVVPLFLGDHWLPMIPVLQVMCAIGFVRSITGNISTLLYALGKPNSVLFSSFVCAVVMVPAYYMLANAFHISGIYFTWLVIYPLLGPVLMIGAISRIGGISKRQFALNLLAPIASSLILFGIVTFVTVLFHAEISAAKLLMLQVFTGVLSYLVSMWLLFRPEALDVVNLLRGKVSSASHIGSDSGVFMTGVRKALSFYRDRFSRPAISDAARGIDTRDKVGLGDYDPGCERAIEEGVRWLLRAQSHSASQDGGVAQNYSLNNGWATSYPETTGYIIPTLLESPHAPELLSAVRRMVDWLVSIQLPGGAFQGGFIGSEPKVPVVFNTGQIVFGLTSAWQLWGEAYEDPLHKAASWLVEHQDPIGAWRKFESPFAPEGDKSYDIHVAWALFEAAKATGQSMYHESAIRHVDWVLKQEKADAWFDHVLMPHADEPITHVMGYLLRGLAEAYRFTGRQEILDAAVRYGTKLMELTSSKDGYLAGQIRKNWTPRKTWVCPTGTVQIAHAWFLIFQFTGERKFLDKARIANAFVRRCTEWEGTDDYRGAVKGSFPSSGEYFPYAFPNWATKFAVDSYREEIRMRTK